MVLSLLQLVLLFGAVRQFEAMRQSYYDLCNSTEVKVKFINELSLSAEADIMETGYIMNPYYEFTNNADFYYSKVDWAVTNDIASYAGEEADMLYWQFYMHIDYNKPQDVRSTSGKE